MNEDQARTVVFESLRQVAPEVDVSDLDPAASLQEALDLDSMDFLSLMTAICDATGIDIPERDYPSIATLEGCVAYLTRSPSTA